MNGYEMNVLILTIAVSISVQNVPSIALNICIVSIKA